MMIEPLEKQDQTAEAFPAAAEVCLHEQEQKAHRARGLLLIGLFKLSKALFFIAVGIAALHLVHKDVGDVLLRVTSAFHLAPDGRFVGMLQDRVDLVSGHKLRLVGLYTFLYAALSLVEGVGLVMEQTWAEYLTLTLTICALPWDVTELARHPSPIRAAVVAINVAVLAYLLWFVWWHRRRLRSHD